MKGVNWLSFGIRVSVNSIFPALNSLEKNILNTIRKQLKDEYIEVFENQFSSVNVVRHFSMESIEIYLLTWSVTRIGWDQERVKYFNQSLDSQCLANFSICGESEQPLKGKLIAKNGVLNCIKISTADQTYKKLSGSKNLTIKINHGLITS